MERLKEHPAVTGARWQPSRRSFNITLQDKKTPLEFTVKHIRSSKGVENDGHVETQFAMTMTKALEVLNDSEVEPATDREAH